MRRGVAGGRGGEEEGRGARDDAPRVSGQHPEPQQVLLPQLRHRLHATTDRAPSAGPRYREKRGAAGQTPGGVGFGRKELLAAGTGPADVDSEAARRPGPGRAWEILNRTERAGGQ